MRESVRGADGGEWQTVRRRHLGCMADAYIARKRRFNNDRFGFVRFNNVKDVDQMVVSLNSLSIRGHKLSANFSQVPRPPSREYDHPTRPSTTYVLPKMTPLIIGNEDPTVQGKSFRDVVSGVDSRPEQLPPPLVPTPSSKWKSFHIPDEASSYPSTFFDRTLLGEAKDASSLCSVKFLLSEGVGADFDVVYAGGFHVLLVFNNKSKAEDFIQSNRQWWVNYFVSLEIWSGQAFPRLRIIRLKILGVPLHLRNDVSYDTIAKGFGRLVWPSNSSWMLEDCSGGSVHVLSESWKTVDETVIITWKDFTYTVMVKEDTSTWTPIFLEEEKVPSPAFLPVREPEMEETWEDGVHEDDWLEDGADNLVGLGGGTMVEENASDIEGFRDACPENAILNIGTNIFISPILSGVDVSLVGPSHENFNGEMETDIHRPIGPSCSGGPLLCFNSVGPGTDVRRSAPETCCPDLNASASNEALSPHNPKAQPKGKRMVSGGLLNRVHRGGGKLIFWSAIAKTQGGCSRSNHNNVSLKSSIWGIPQSEFRKDVTLGEGEDTELGEEVTSTIQIGACVGVNFTGCEDQVAGVLKETGNLCF
ncbi:hypothetical protein SSX86_004061 [Deinandra increscens subsp. villosa]|uniref:Nucleotide-binding alpha-beta plait domain-containing protein n=1 Tax=Deinandra increscens subsp. villosa TaxID=3103831 RepID=A0AAP0H8P1_9ASTR